jgi:hypothetical protein
MIMHSLKQRKHNLKPRQAQPQQHALPHPQVMMDYGNMQVDPSLLLAIANDPSMMNRGMQNQFSE